MNVFLFNYIYYYIELFIQETLNQIVPSARSYVVVSWKFFFSFLE